MSSIDLNLLHVVDAVLQERSATRAAARLHVTQSAVSNALRRARELFGDPLVVRTGRGFRLTPRGVELAPRLRSLLEDAQGLVENDFDPLTCERELTLACTDAIAAVSLSRVLAVVSRRMPHARVRAVALDHVVAQGGLARTDIDLLVGSPPEDPEGCSSEPLFVDSMKVIADANHPSLGSRLGRRQYASLPHAELGLFGQQDHTIDIALGRLDLTRTVAVTVPYITALPFVVAGSERIATVIESVARAFAPPLGLKVLTPPLRLAPLRVRQVWHRRVEHDPAVKELRDSVRQALARAAP